MSSNKETVYVIGHRNPDTDSICSAIALANLKNELAKQHRPVPVSASYSGTEPSNVVYKAAMAGKPNNETRYVLNRFGFKAPYFLPDARTQVKDIVYSNATMVRENISLRTAWLNMRRVSKSTLGVEDEDGNLAGVITTGDIAKSYMAVFDNEVLARAKTPYRNIIETLNGKLLTGDPDRIVEKGKVRIAAANTDIMRQLIDEHDVIITSNRYESQLCAIEQKVDMIIVCDGARVSRTIQMIARENDCAIVSTPYGTYEAARLINQSMPVGYFMTRNPIRFRNTDYIDDIRSVMTRERHRDFPVVDGRGHFVGMISRRNLVRMKSKQLILVDHNEPGQAVNGIKEAEVVEIVDHHKLGTLDTVKPIVVRNRPVGCTATIVTKMYEESKVEISPEIAGLLCSAIISDTLLFRSPTCTPLDEKTAQRLAQIAGIDPKEHAIAMFDAGSEFMNMSEDAIVYQDFKKFKSGDITFGIGQVNSMSKDDLQKVKDRLKPYISKVMDKEGMNMLFFMLTDIVEDGSLVIFCGDKAQELLENGFHKEVSDGEAYLDGVVSRKKQFLPVLLAELNRQEA